jgi:LDH2 family malate/lactate/ureidoglycolate dehydrogenase
MPDVALAPLTEFMRQVLVTIGTPDVDAHLVAGEIAMANRLGVDSHGVLRFPQYVRDVEEGRIIPGGEIRTITRTSTTAIVDCGYNFGQVSAFAALRIAVDIAAEAHVACVVTRRSNHVGRVGAYVEAAARRGFVSMAFVTTSPRSHMVAPFGGREGRLGTNPIAYGAPTLDEPIVADFATSVFSEGKLRIAMQRGKPMAEPASIDRDGRISDDPSAFYRSPRGSLLPVGGGAGYKGTALGMLAEILSGQLAGEDAADAIRPANGLCLLVIDPSAFLDPADFAARIGDLRDYVRSATTVPGTDRILVPGDREAMYAAAVADAGERIWVDDAVWQEIEALRTRLGVEPIES